MVAEWLAEFIAEVEARHGEGAAESAPDVIAALKERQLNWFVRATKARRG
jgi:hypothetical protein